MNGGITSETHVVIRRDADVIVACQRGRALAEALGLSDKDQVIVITAISEVANNIVSYAGCGEIAFSTVRQGDRAGVAVVARDDGPGIPDVELALQDGFSTSGSLGLGLSGARRLMDEFEIISLVGIGTTVTMRKWRE